MERSEIRVVGLDLPGLRRVAPASGLRLLGMFKKHYILAVVSFLLIPAVTVLGGMLFGFINPEIAARHSNYERNYRLLELAKNLTLLAALLVNIGLWLLTCSFLIKSKKRSSGWLFLALLGPFGLIVLTMLSDTAPTPGDLYQQFVGKMRVYLRVAYELCLFVVVWVVAFQAMVLKRDLMIMYQAAATGTTRAQIINEQNASSGMWAFSEGLEVLYLVVLFYLLWPICFRAAGQLPKLWAFSKKA
jgi:hypothetical protein